MVECMVGTPCSRPIHQLLKDKALDRLIYQLAKSQIKLSSLTFDSLGSLYPAPHSPTGGFDQSTVVGPSISLRFINPDPPYFLGPFRTAGERYLANIDSMLHKLADGDRSHGHPAVRYLVHLWYRGIITSFPSLWGEEEIMIRHADDKGDHILSDLEGNLCGIIDWEW